MQILPNTGGVAMTNCFVIADESTRQAVLFDAPDHTVAPLLDPATKSTASFDLTSILLTLALTIGKVVAFVAIMLVFGRRLIPWVMHYIAHTGSRELFRLGVLAIALGVAFASAKLFGVSPVVAATDVAACAFTNEFGVSAPDDLSALIEYLASAALIANLAKSA